MVYHARTTVFFSIHTRAPFTHKRTHTRNYTTAMRMQVDRFFLHMSKHKLTTTKCGCGMSSFTIVLVYFLLSSNR